MLKILTLQGRDLTPDDIETVRSLLLLHPGWSRRRVSIALAEEWNWRTPSGQLKDMAARSLLLKLEERGLIQLPPRRSWADGWFRRCRLCPPRPLRFLLL